LPVDIISAGPARQGHRRHQDRQEGKSEPLVEKVAEAKPVEDAVGKITGEGAGRDDTSPPPQPKVEPKPVERNPTRRSRSPRSRRRAEAGEEQEQPRSNRSEALKKERRSPPRSRWPRPPSRRARKPKTSGPSTSRRSLGTARQRDPSRQAVAGDTLNSNAALGLCPRQVRDNSATWGSMFKQQVERCWKKPYGGIESQEA